MCQYDLGYSLYCTNKECENVQFVIQEQFREDFPEYKRLFAKYKRPCDCDRRWYQWHYYATPLGRYKKPFVKLCDECVQERKAEVKKCKGNVTEEDKTRIRAIYPTYRREPYARNGVPPASVHKGFILEHDLRTGIPKPHGRIINRFAYDSDDGTSVSGKSTPRGKPREAESEPMRYLEDAERPTQRITAYQDDGDRPDADNASEIYSESEGDESDSDWGKGQGKEREKPSAPPRGSKHFHRIEDKDYRIEDEDWVRKRAALLRVFDFASYSEKVDRADAKLEAAIERASGSEFEPDDGQTESSVAPTSVVSSSVVSSSAFSQSTVTSAPSRKRSVRFREDYEDEYESASEVSSAMDRLNMQGRRR